MLWRWLWLALVLLAGGFPTAGAEARIIKVLPHLLDANGRAALSPSLYERDAYQAHLRQNRDEISSLRFDVQYKSRIKDPLVLRIEIRGSKMDLGQSRTFETDVEPRRWFSSWGRLRLSKQVYEEIGTIVAWRASLRHNGEEIAELESFLW